MQFKTSNNFIEYPAALLEMEKRVHDIISGKESELIWLLEHPPLYTAGTSAKNSDLLEAKFPVYAAGRGGEYTYHGPGQRIAYVMLNLKKREMMDIKKYVWNLEEVIIKTLLHFGIKGERREGRVGIWVVSQLLVGSEKEKVNSRAEARASPEKGGKQDKAEQKEMVARTEVRASPELCSMEKLGNFSGSIKNESKIAAIGIRIKKWVTYHGISVNINPNLAHFSGIVPCGIKEYGVTSFEKLNKKTTMPEFDEILKAKFLEVF